LSAKNEPSTEPHSKPGILDRGQIGHLLRGQKLVDRAE
jgi:hypothetical protein